MKCSGLAGYLFGHEYEPRYSTTPPDGFSFGPFKGSADAYTAAVDAWKVRQYHGDVCKRCGHVVNEQKK